MDAPICVAYVPGVHEGYRRFFLESNTRGAQVLYVLGKDFLGEFPRLERDMRALSPEIISRMVQTLGIFSSVQVLEKNDLISTYLSSPALTVILPDEDISHFFAEKYLEGRTLSFHSIFLRWDMKAALSRKLPEHDRTVSRSAFDKELMREAFRIAERSSDWWRRVGAIAVRDGRVLAIAYNRHMPSEQSPYVEGDPRSNFDAGERQDICTALHSEKAIVAQAAKEGRALNGTALYVTTFPCPDCARVIGEAGIKKVYYTEGYSLLEAGRIFEHYGIEVVLVEM